MEVTLLFSSIHEIFSDNAENFINVHHPSFAQIKVIKHITSCKTPSLGAAAFLCGCGQKTFVFHSCRDRHCPVCQGMNNARWADKQLASSLPVKYFHIVFTLPDLLNNFVLTHQKESYSTLFGAAREALLRLCADKKHLGATPGFTAVLHTWGQQMQFHPHLHVIISAGGLADRGLRFVDVSDKNFLVPVKALSKIFRAAFISGLSRKTGIDASLKDSLWKKDFFCYLKEPLERSDNAVFYLARYANRVCISDRRILSYDKIARTVTFSYKDNRNGGVSKTLTLSALEFMRRFLLHVLPRRFMKIRHFGILNNRGKLSRLAQCRRLLHAQTPLPRKHSPRRIACPACGKTLSDPRHITANALAFEILRC
jgi:hypothetical protein